MGWLSDKWEKWSQEGVRLPFVYDSAAKAPSMTLGFCYITFWITLGSVIALHFKPNLSVATWTCMSWWAIAQILYMVRKVSKMKLDIRNQAVELENDEKESPKEEGDTSK